MSMFERLSLSVTSSSGHPGAVQLHHLAWLRIWSRLAVLLLVQRPPGRDTSLQGTQLTLLVFARLLFSQPVEQYRSFQLQGHDTTFL
ncbi:MAG: hypothetical protein IPM39_28510 [Chloroflexi bacterium]|nr:hypothetical protein [Chloroflexota bacterium]